MSSEYQDAMAAFWNAVETMEPYDDQIKIGRRIARELNNKKYHLGRHADEVATALGEDFLADYAKAIQVPLKEVTALREMVLRMEGRTSPESPPVLKLLEGPNVSRGRKAMS